MRQTVLGVAYCAAFVFIEAAQSVYFGGAFQRTDSFLLGALIFGASSVVFTGWALRNRPEQITIALSVWRGLIVVNALTAFTWSTYFLALQRIEPAVAYTIVSGLLPLSVVATSNLGARGAESAKNPTQAVGHLAIAGALAILAIATLTGRSGFVRGGGAEGGIGLALATMSGFSVTATIFTCGRLDRAGLGPELQFGLRFVLYAVLAGVFAVTGLDAKPTADPANLVNVFVIGVVLIAVPIYAFQRAIPLVSALTIGVVSALGPVCVLGMEALEGRVAYAPWTLVGVVVYAFGAIASALGAALPAPRTRRALPQRHLS